jgi:uncharacterized repeat protein (TIGR03803 family)
MLQFSDGNLYGTTTSGGSNGYGAVFQLTAGGRMTPLYSFTGGDDGSAPEAALIDGNDGTLYGVCTSGGANDTGTIFNITTAGVLTPLYSFTATSPGEPYNNNDGASPRALILGSDGNFYGVAYEGGVNGAGTMFQFSQSNGLTVFYSFSYLLDTGEVYSNSDGGEPLTLLQTSDDNFYGAAFAGGTNGYGTFFRIGLPPQITVQPISQTVSLYSGATFSVSATGAQVCQWQLDNTNIPNATNYTLSLTNVLLANAGYYQAILTNINGATASSVVTLGITNVPVSFVAGGGALSYAGGQAMLELTNFAGQGEVIIDASPDLIQWTPIFTNPPAFGALQFIDMDAVNYTNRFYRARTQ